MEFLKLVRRRSFLSEVVYTILNVALAIAILLVIRYTESIPLAIALVVLSKWRVFAVRARYWFVNLRSNLIDFIVSFSVVVLLYSINLAAIEDTRKLILMGIGTLLYIIWLLVLKPQSKRVFVAAQAAVAILLGVTALFAISYNWPASLVVAGMWLIGYSAANHVLNTYDEETHTLFLALAWSVVMAELGWLSYHVTIAHAVPFITALQIPQIAIMSVLVSFVAYKSYDSFYHYQKIRTADIVLPILFTVAMAIVLWFALPSIQCQAPTVLLCLGGL